MRDWLREHDYLLLAALQRYAPYVDMLVDCGWDRDDVVQECRVACWKSLQGSRCADSTAIYRATKLKLLEMTKRAAAERDR